MTTHYKQMYRKLHPTARCRRERYCETDEMDPEVG